MNKLHSEATESFRKQGRHRIPVDWNRLALEILGNCPVRWMFVLILLSGGCTHDQLPIKLGGYGIATISVIGAVMLGVLAECQTNTDLKERYDRLCGLLLLLALCAFLAA
ncbi:hypothetical protein KBB96_16510 [Luteolibacter ambystomatis]|uniref:Uncharacterized protein n=1 Tax=Luteolibacter ambystomatis TaxID=2824561 RepID=A0A975G6X8_9BACT|nr:hypothetical protein [Luteolibacter ambystomatis]QUE50457.1 hypothetical protein KBB96_16510 [Luteolibacter ambystomatis]